MNSPARLTRLSLAHPVWTLSVIGLITAFFGAGIPRIERETSLRTFLGPEHAAVVDLDRHLETFGGGYPVIIAYSCEETPHCETVFDAAALQMAEDVRRSLQATFGVQSVYAVSNAPLLLADGDDLAVHRFAQDDGIPAQTSDELARLAASDPLWARTLVGREGAVGAIILELSSSESAVQKAVAEALETTLAPHREDGWRFHLVGELVDFVYSGIDIERDSQAMVPVMTGVLLVVLVVLLRSAWLAGAVLASMGFAFLWTQGMMGWSGVSLNALTTVTPSIVFAIGILDGVHLVTHWSRRSWERQADTRAERQALLVDTARDIGPACFLTSLTTMAAFMAFLAAGIASFAEFALLAAWGVLAALVLSFTLLPIVLAHLPVRTRGAQRVQPAWEALLGAVVHTVHRSKGLILAVSTVILLICLFGVSRVRVEIEPHRLIGESTRPITWARWVAENLRETESLEIALTLPADASYRDPEILAELARITTWLDSDLERIGHSQSVVTVLSHTNQLLHGGNAAFSRPADTRTGNAQIALLLSLQDGDLLDRWVGAGWADSDTTGSTRQVLRISSEAESMSTPLQAELVRQIETHLDSTLPEGWGYVLTGSVPMYLQMMTSLQHNQLICFGAAGIVLFVLMALFLRSPGLALVALIPSAAPCIATIGLLGLWDYGLDPASTMVATIILGVAVDDSIHLLTRYQRHRRAGLPSGAAVDAAIAELGRAVITSSLVLAAAFWSLTLSAAASLATFGFLAGLAILAALAADLFVLPTLLSTPRLVAWLAPEPPPHEAAQ